MSSRGRSRQWAWPGAASEGAAGARTAGLAADGLAPVRPGRAARAPQAPGQGNGAGDSATSRRGRALRRRIVVGTMNGGENDLLSGQYPGQGEHGMKAWQYGHGIQVPLPPQNADNT